MLTRVVVPALLVGQKLQVLKGYPMYRSSSYVSKREMAVLKYGLVKMPGFLNYMKLN